MTKDKTNIEEIEVNLHNQWFELTNIEISPKIAIFLRWVAKWYTPKDQVQAECEKPILKHIDERLKQHRDNLELWNNGTLTPTAEDEQDIELTKEGLKACIYELSELKDFIQKGAKGV